MRNLMSKYGPIVTALFVVVVFGIVVFLMAGCGTSTEVFSDTEIGDRDSTPAKIIEMPDGFSNVATKCVDGNQVYVIFRPKNGQGNFGSLAVVPGCAEATR